MLLSQESVQKDLQLNPQQVQALTTIFEQQRTAMSQAFQLDREERGARLQDLANKPKPRSARSSARNSSSG